MKKTLFVALAIVLGGALTTANAAKKEKKDKKIAAPVEVIKLNTAADSLSYAAGMANTNGLQNWIKRQFKVEDAEMPDFIRGFEDAMKKGADRKVVAYGIGQHVFGMVKDQILVGTKTELAKFNEAVNDSLFTHGFLAALKKDKSVMADSVATDYFEKTIKANIDAENMKNKKTGEDFLAENAKKEGVVTLPSGLQYKVLTAGTGEKPKATNRVTVKYEGKTLDGKVFDSSYKRNPQTTTFGVTQVIKGWTEALQLMPVGSKWELYIPYNLAYGERGTGNGSIKPYDALIFTVELVDIEKPATAKAETKPAIKAASKIIGKKSAAKSKKK